MPPRRRARSGTETMTPLGALIILGGLWLAVRVILWLFTTLIPWLIALFSALLYAARVELWIAGQKVRPSNQAPPPDPDSKKHRQASGRSPAATPAQVQYDVARRADF